MSASVGLAIQCVGILLVALLSMSMHGSIKSASLKCRATAGTSPVAMKFSGVNLTGCVPGSDVLALHIRILT